MMDHHAHITLLETLATCIKMPGFVSYFPHPLKPDHKVNVFLDICHMLKLMRNTLVSNGVLKDEERNLIKWDYVKELHKIQENEGLHLGSKVSKVHME